MQSGNGTANSGRTPQYKKFPDGTIRLRGGIQNAGTGSGSVGGTAQAVGDILFTLPSGYRPAVACRFGGLAPTNTGFDSAVEISTAGVAP